MKIKKSKIENKFCLILPPQKRTIFVENIFFRKRKYFLSFPYIFFLFFYEEYSKKLDSKNTGLELQKSFMCFSEDERGTNIYFPPLLNINPRLEICMGGEFDFSFESKEDLIKRFMKSFWQTEFNTDSSGSYKIYKDRNPIIIDYDFWEDMTKKEINWVPDKSFLVKIDCENYPYTDYKSFFFENFYPIENCILQ